MSPLAQNSDAVHAIPGTDGAPVGVGKVTHVWAVATAEYGTVGSYLHEVGMQACPAGHPDFAVQLAGEDVAVCAQIPATQSPLTQLSSVTHSPPTAILLTAHLHSAQTPVEHSAFEEHASPTFTSGVAPPQTPPTQLKPPAQRY